MPSCKTVTAVLSANLALTLVLASPGSWAQGRPSSAPQAARENAAPSPQAASYWIGLMLGEQFQHDGIASQLQTNEIIRGLKDATAGKTLTPEQRNATLQFLRSGRAALDAHNRTVAGEFLARNAHEPGVITLPSGLQYRVLNAGEAGAKRPSANDQVTVRYRAALADGTEFDRSDTHDRPATFVVKTVLKGWQEALLAMPEGAKWQLFVPPDLGYGANPPPQVPPGSLLIYELELLRIGSVAPAPAAARGPPPTPSQ